MNFKRDWMEGWKVVARLIWFNIVAGVIFFPVKYLASFLHRIHPESRALSIGSVVLALIVLIALGPICMALASRFTGILGSCDEEQLGWLSRKKSELRRMRGDA